MKVKTKITCPGCKLGTEVAFKKPGLFEATIFDFRCSACESICAAKVLPAKVREDRMAGRVDIHVVVKHSSKLLLDIQQEEAAAQSGEVQANE